MSSSEVLGNIRYIVVCLNRGNVAQAEALVTDVAAHLKGILVSGADPESFEMRRTQQTMFAIDEVRILLSQRDFDGAMDAARDAIKEWTHKPVSGQPTQLC